MPLEERRNRHQALMRSVRRYDVHWWCDELPGGAGHEAQAEEKRHVLAAAVTHGNAFA